MTKILSIDSYDGTVLVNLIDGTNNCVFIGDSGRRPLKSTDGAITRTFRFKMTGSTRALARTAVNAFMYNLRQAVRWNEDTQETVSVFLREAADGETPVRSLILNYDAYAADDGSAIDAYQTMNTELYIDVALTLQDHREEASKTTLTGVEPDAEYAVGQTIVLYGSSATANSRVFIDLISNLSGNFLKKLWVGMHRSSGDGFNFRHIWYFDHASSLSFYATETTTAGSYGTNVVKVSNFSGASMQQLVGLNVYDQYLALGRGPWSNEAKGRYIALIRYKCEASTGSVLLRVGTAASEDDDIAYTEPRLINGDGNWHFINAGVVSFPPVPNRIEGAADNTLANAYLYVAGQRLSGTDMIYFDTVTFIPHDHYIQIENTPISELYTGALYVNEDLQPGIYSKLVADDSFVRSGKIVDKNNFMYPVAPVTNHVVYGDQRYVRLVFAAEFDDSQIYNTNLANDDVKIIESFEAYNV